jgi:hypothetical protein
LGVVNTPTIILRPVQAEQTIGRDWIAVISVVHSFAKVAQRVITAILGKFGVANNLTAAVVIHSSAPPMVSYRCFGLLR